MITECQCWMPEYAYRDWLTEQGWEVDEEEVFEIVFSGWFRNSMEWKVVGVNDYDYVTDQQATAVYEYGTYHDLEYYRSLFNYYPELQTQEIY